MPVVTQSLTKHYGPVAALNRCSLTIDRGQVFGLLGPNGSGKTTLIRLLMGFLRPTDGTAKVDGLDCYREPVRVHERVSYLPGEVRLFRQMRGHEVLRLLSDLRPTADSSNTPASRFEKSKQLAEQWQLDLSRPVAAMSTGMRQKLALAAVLAVPVPLWILDEPTANLDPTMRSQVLSNVERARAEGRTVIFSSHILSEVEQVCDRVVILRRGEIVHDQIIKNLRRRHRIKARLTGELPQVPQHFDDQVKVALNGSHALTIETTGELAPLLGWLATLPLAEVQIEPVGLQAVYEQFHGEPQS